jgi:hypothetical protein
MTTEEAIMLEELLELGTIFDWISPTLSIAQDLTNGPSHTFLIPQDCGWTGMEIANLLRRRGIKTWGHMIVNGTFMITVRQPQSEFARYLLQQAGLPTGIEPAPPSRRRPAGSSGRSNSGSLGDLLKEIGNIRL